VAKYAPHLFFLDFDGSYHEYFIDIYAGLKNIRKNPLRPL